MKIRSPRPYSSVTAALAACMLPAIATAQDRAERAVATLTTSDGEPIGTAQFTQRGDLVEVRVELHGRSPGWHGFHLHEHGVCEAGEQFATAGGHLGSEAADHPDHAGDLPAALVMQSGDARLVVDTDRFAVSDLLAGDGTAVMVHEQRDNFAHIPERYVPEPDRQTLDTGDAGARLACGVVRRP
jgi:superoxide dismutase, Cu-Zn family